MDQILGKQGSKAKDVYASKISLASRIVKVERQVKITPIKIGYLVLNEHFQVDDIEIKIDQLMEMYLEDRKRLRDLPFSQKDSSVSTSAILKPKPKPILVDKQASEPSSPEAKSFREVARRPMQRGFSDLGNRIKKRVTLR